MSTELFIDLLHIVDLLVPYIIDRLNQRHQLRLVDLGLDLLHRIDVNHLSELLARTGTNLTVRAGAEVFDLVHLVDALRWPQALDLHLEHTGAVPVELGAHARDPLVDAERVHWQAAVVAFGGRVHAIALDEKFF